MKKMQSFARILAAIAKVTFLGVLHQKVLYNVLLVAFSLLGLSILAAQLSFIGADRILLDFGLSSVHISSVMLAIFLSSSTLNREFERRTIYVALSRPISRAEYAVGLYIGIVGVLFVNWILLCGLYLGALLTMGQMPWSLLAEHLSSNLAAALILLLWQASLVASIGLVFSTYSSTAVSFMLTSGCYLIGSSATQLKLIASQSGKWIQGTLGTFSNLVPNLEYFNLGMKVTYGIPIHPNFLWSGILYGSVWIALGLTLSALFIRTKEI